MTQNAPETVSGPSTKQRGRADHLITVADLPSKLFPTIQIPENRYEPLAAHGTRRAYKTPGTTEHHIRGILGGCHRTITTPMSRVNAEMDVLSDPAR